MRQRGAGERPAGPSPPASLLAAGLIHAIGQVLKMHARIADKNVGRSFLQQPDNGRIWQRPDGKYGFVATHIGKQCAVEAKDGTGGEAATPQVMTVIERGEIKIRATIGAMKIKRAPVHLHGGFREVRTGWKGLSGHARLLAGIAPGVNAAGFAMRKLNA